MLDATNPLDYSQGLPPKLAVKGEDSAGERVQQWLPEARVVKAFNTVGHLHMVDPSFPGGPPDMFLCGQDAGAKRTVTELANSLGWPVIDIGGIANARYREAMAMVFIINAFATGNWNTAFKLLKK